MADEAVVGVVAERREVDEPDPVGDDGARRQAAAVQQRHVEAAGEAAGERQRAHEVAEAERVLAVEEQAASHARTSWARSRRAGRTASTSGRTRLTARTACSPSRAAATCHRMAASGGGVRTDR